MNAAYIKRAIKTQAIAATLSLLLFIILLSSVVSGPLNHHFVFFYDIRAFLKVYCALPGRSGFNHNASTHCERTILSSDWSNGSTHDSVVLPLFPEGTAKLEGKWSVLEGKNKISKLPPLKIVFIFF